MNKLWMSILLFMSHVKSTVSVLNECTVHFRNVYLFQRLGAKNLLFGAAQRQSVPSRRCHLRRRLECVGTTVEWKAQTAGLTSCHRQARSVKGTASKTQEFSHPKNHGGAHYQLVAQKLSLHDSGPLLYFSNTTNCSCNWLGVSIIPRSTSVLRYKPSGLSQLQLQMLPFA